MAATPACSKGRARRRSFRLPSVICSASAGIVITASHNPPHDNGYKVYFSDGAQVVEPHASGIIAKVNAIASETYEPLPASRARQRHHARQGDRRRLHGAARNADPRSRAGALGSSDLRIVFTPIHGTGGVIIKPMLERLGFQFSVGAGAGRIRRRFPTVKSPNPENAEALKLGDRAGHRGEARTSSSRPIRIAIAWAWRCATATGEMELLTGNQIGSLMAYYRAQSCSSTA